MVRNIKNLAKRLLKPKNTSLDILKGADIKGNFTIGRYKHILIEPGATIKIAGDVDIREFCNILVFKHASLFIEKNVFFNNYCSINCLDRIEIGENTLFGEGVKIYDHNHKHEWDNGKLVVERNEFNTAPIKIGSNCWIGSNVTILKGVEIGDNVIIGANNLIYKSIPANSIVKANTSFNLSSYDV